MTESRRIRGAYKYAAVLDDAAHFKATMSPIFPQGHLFYEITPLPGAGGSRGALHQLVGQMYRTSPRALYGGFKPRAPATLRLTPSARPGSLRGCSTQIPR